jgi:hypothetical protein
MATAEQMLNEAQYAFANISFGESLSNTRHAAQAKSLARKIIRKFPATMEASEARAILRRLGEEAYTSEMPIRHRHVKQAEHHDSWKPPAASRTPRVGQVAGRGDTLDWGGLIGLVFGLPRVILFVVLAAGFVLFSLFGWLIVLPLVALVLFTGPFRSLLQPAQRDQLNNFIVRVNALIDEQRKPGGYS